MADWTSFTKKIAIKAAIDTIYKAWTTRAGIEKWFLRTAIYTDRNGKTRDSADEVMAGDTYFWQWHGFPDAVKEENEVVYANGKDEFQFTFTGKCLVTVKLTDNQGNTVVALTQSDIPKDDNPATNLYIGCGEGWTFYLANLKSICEGGIDLRNKDESIQGVINS